MTSVANKIRSNNDNRMDISDQYSWLKNTHSVEAYIGSRYYDKLLKDYIFNGKTDLQIFQNFLLRRGLMGDVLELGSGNGRATEVYCQFSTWKTLTLVDLSPIMLRGAKLRLGKKTGVRYVCSDIFDFIQSTDRIYDCIFTLWSFSHSVHQWLSLRGLAKGKKLVYEMFKKMVEKNMRQGSIFFLIHFDSNSDEQRMLMRQWKRVFPIFRNTALQSPSKRYIDRALIQLSRSGLIKYDVRHLVGKAIEYDSMDEALEIFMNFHLESYFNDSLEVSQIIDDLTRNLKQYQKPNGKIYVKPGCFIYTLTKII